MVALNLGLVDYAVIALYFLVFVFLAFLVRAKSLKTYWTNDRATGTLALTLSIVSTIVGAGAVFATAAMAYSGGTAPFFLGGAYVLGLVALGVLAPRLSAIASRHQIYSLPDFLEIMFSRRCRFAGAAVQFFVYFFYLAGQLVALGTICSLMTGLSLTLSLGAAVLLVLTYTLLGGIKMDIIADNVQFFVLLLMIVLLPLFSWDQGQTIERIRAMPSDFLAGSELGGWPFIIGLVVILMPGVLVSGDSWMRIYSARSPQVARRAFFTSSFLVFIFVAVIAYIGLAARGLFPDIDSNQALISMIAHYIPQGMLGFIVAGLLAAVLSTADSMLLVTGMTITEDVIGSFVPHLREHEQKMLLLARGANIVNLLLALLLALLIPDIVKIMVNGASVLVILVPAVLVGLYAKNKNEAAVFWSVITGFVMTFVGFLIMPATPFIPGIGTCLVTFATFTLWRKGRVR